MYDYLVVMLGVSFIDNLVKMTNIDKKVFSKKKFGNNDATQI